MRWQMVRRRSSSLRKEASRYGLIEHADSDYLGMSPNDSACISELGFVAEDGASDAISPSTAESSASPSAGPRSSRLLAE